MAFYIRRICMLLCMVILFCSLLLSERAGAAKKVAAEQTSGWYFPADGTISDVFDSRGGKHKGMDIAGRLKTPVFAVDNGTVIKSYLSSSYGNVIFIHHINGFETVYAHLNKRLVKKGQQIKKGDEIGLMGSTGYSTGTHLHFEIHKGKWTITKKNAIDPFEVFGKGNIGQTVSALEHHPFPAMEVSGKGATVQQQHGQRKQTVYDVKKSDTLWSIARTHHTTADSIKRVNRLRNDKIQPGQSLTIQETNQGGTYIVRKGDTANRIARQFHITVQELQNRNHLENINMIRVNQVLNVKS